MSQIEIDRNPKGQKIPGKVAFVATLLLPILGAACLVMPEPVAEHLPHLLGGVMLFVGTADIVTDILERNSNPGKITVGTDVVMDRARYRHVAQHACESLNVIAVMWGPAGSGERRGGDRRVPEGVRCRPQVDRSARLLNFRAGARHHAAARAHCQLGPSRVLLLGLELVVYPFHVASHEGQPSA
ncbi:MAG: hypothetical protein ACLTSX_12030 [Collinsella sp.]